MSSLRLPFVSLSLPARGAAVAAVFGRGRHRRGSRSIPARSASGTVGGGGGLGRRRGGGGRGRSESLVGTEKRLPIEGNVTRLGGHQTELGVGGDDAMNLWRERVGEDKLAMHEGVGDGYA